MANEKGPLLSDEQFFKDCLNLNYPGMDQVRQAVQAEDYAKAKSEMATYIRGWLKPEKFFEIPYEVPENIFRYPGETDEQACERLTKHILISVGVPLDYGKENQVDWYANPTSNQYKEWTWQLNRHHELKMLAHEYNRTKDPRWPKLAAELFESWVKQAVFPGNVSGYDTKCWRTIECGIRMGANWPYVLFTFFKTEAFTDQVLIDWYKSVWEHGLRLSRNRTKANWLIMEMNGLAQIGILYPQFQQAEQWRKEAFDQLCQELKRQIYPDGFQYELSTGYHDVVINNYQRLIEVAEKFEVSVPKEIYDVLEKACEIDVKLMMPDGTLPDLNDGHRSSSKELLLPKRRIYPENPHFQYVCTDGRQGEQPKYYSIALEDSGFMVMRNGWGPDSTYGLLDGAPFGRAHQHEDKLSLLIYAQGKLLLTEGGNYAYDDSQMREYVLSTRAHNTIRVDKMDQNRQSEYQWKDEDIQKKAGLLWNIGLAFDYAESNYSEGYGKNCERSAVHTRSIYFVKQPGEGLEPFFLVVDRLKSNKPHTYELLWHIDSEQAECSGCCVDTREMTVSMAEELQNNSRILVVSGQQAPEWQGFVATSTKQGDYRPVNCICAQVTGENLRIVTLLYPHPANQRGTWKVHAGQSLAEQKIVLERKDGKQWFFDETVMKTD